jgi:dTDP-glucose 4,6-dehydratase
MKGTAIITGGMGFMGSHLRDLLATKYQKVVVVDAFTYAARPHGKISSNVTIEKCDIRDHWALSQIFEKYGPSVVYHLAAESHVCRSIEGPRDFITTNVVGTWHVAEECRKKKIRLIHISTDEVFGEIKKGTFTESSPYSPRSPYAASKASGDHIVKCYGETYKLDYVIVHPSNNFGPNQHEEKLIPKTILNILSGKEVIIYGKGDHVREWLYVEDFARGVFELANGPGGRSYCLGGGIEVRNIEIVQSVFGVIDDLWPGRHTLKIRKTGDRPTDDFRYAMRSDKARRAGFNPSKDLKANLRRTVLWYFEQACASMDGGHG